MTMLEQLTVSFMKSMTATAEGRAHLLNLSAFAEGADEGRIFDAVLDHVDEPNLRRMVERHRDDELRHQKMFEAAVLRNGGTPHPAPEELRLLDRVNAKCGGFLQKPVQSTADVARAYLILQAIEERAVTQFGFMEQAFRPVDPESAEVFVAISKDEARHLKYCQAIAKHYIPDDAQRAQQLAEIRRAEAEAFRENGQVSMVWALQHGLIQGWLAQTFWSGVRVVARNVSALPLTPFARAAMAQPAAA